MSKVFNVDKAIAAAWDLLWADNLRRRQKGGYRSSATYYLTASDVENQVRQFAAEQLEGKPWGTYGRAYGRPADRLRISGGDLNSRVRDWLLDCVSRGTLASHNFGRGHISGMRFRPAGEPISEAEKATLEVKSKREGKPRLCHFRKAGGPLCTAHQRRSHRQSSSWCTNNESKVTCPRCKKLLKVPA